VSNDLIRTPGAVSGFGRHFASIIITFRLSKLSEEWNSSWDSSWVDKIPTPQILSILPDMVSLVDTHGGFHSSQ
jgi:hypothetical protein